MNILVGDIGGTQTRLALVRSSRQSLEIENLKIFKNSQFASLETVLERFLTKDFNTVQSACFGIAGPVIGNRCITPNLEWEVDGYRLARHLDISRTFLLNDLQATALGIFELKPSDFMVLQEGKPDPSGNAALIAAGTGLGEAGIHRIGDDLHPFPSEGGHTDFSPQNQVEMNLSLYLAARYNHVSWERVVSGQGILNIYSFIRDGSTEDEPVWLREQFEKIDPAAAISKAAEEKTDTVCAAAMDLFLSLYGAEAGNVALKFLATSGLFVGGGIAPKIQPLLASSDFMKSFLNKGRMKPLLQDVPVKVILNESTPLLGAARHALKQMKGT
ncbi:glucokinase [bacterium]|nr:glucokinase [candidate division CSSED10-310 bacterium]